MDFGRQNKCQTMEAISPHPGNHYGDVRYSEPEKERHVDIAVIQVVENSSGISAHLDCATGKTRWTAPRSSAKAAYSTPIIYPGQAGAAEPILKREQSLSSLGRLPGDSPSVLD